MKALVGAFNQEKALVGAFSVIWKPILKPMDRFTALVEKYHKAGDHGRSLQTREREQQLQEAVNWELEI